MSHCGLAIYIKKYLKAEEELWKLLKYFFTMQKYNLQKVLYKKPKSFKIFDSSITNLKFQHKLKKNMNYQKSSYKNRPIIIIT